MSGVPEPPPPPPPAPAAREPVRIGGNIEPPALVYRVEPVYPPAAVAARLQGIVILEALVDREGLGAEVKVLRSAGTILDRQALAAVRQWRYSPLLRNGRRERFILIVTRRFRCRTAHEGGILRTRAKDFAYAMAVQLASEERSVPDRLARLLIQ